MLFKPVRHLIMKTNSHVYTHLKHLSSLFTLCSSAVQRVSPPVIYLDPQEFSLISFSWPTTTSMLCRSVQISTCVHACSDFSYVHNSSHLKVILRKRGRATGVCTLGISAVSRLVIWCLWLWSSPKPHQAAPSYSVDAVYGIHNDLGSGLNKFLKSET